MSTVIRAHGLRKVYGNTTALGGIDLDVQTGRIVGMIGPNGAGKTTALKAVLGLTSFDGDLEVLGMDPRSQRPKLMRQVCFIADVATLPRWIRVHQVIEFCAAVHPNFHRDKAEQLLKRTKVTLDRKVKELSKGMVTQLHLALVMAIDAKLLVLDEPTLGLDILYRKEFYANLLNDYFDEERTIIITTHQVEEIENLLTDLVFIKDGKVVLDCPMEALSKDYVEVMVKADDVDKARRLKPIHERKVFGRHVFLFENTRPEELAAFEERHTPSVADLFVAKMMEAA